MRLVHEAKGELVTVELDNGESYKGRLVEADDSMNMRLEAVTITDKKGRAREAADIFIRGSMITFVSLPESLPVAPILQAAAEAQAAAASGDKAPGKRDRA